MKKPTKIKGGLKELEKMYGYRKKTEGVTASRLSNYGKYTEGTEERMPLSCSWNTTKEDAESYPLEEKFNKLIKGTTLMIRNFEISSAYNKIAGLTR